MTGIIPIRLNDVLLQKISTMNGDIGKSTFCKNIVTSFINSEFCMKSDFENMKSELNTTRNNVQTPQIEISKGKHELKTQNDKLINTISSIELIKFELTNKDELMNRYTKQVQALQLEKHELKTKLRKFEDDIKGLENKNAILQKYEIMIRNAENQNKKLTLENQMYKQLDLEFQLRKMNEAKQQQQGESIARIAAFIFPKLRIR